MPDTGNINHRLCALFFIPAAMLALRFDVLEPSTRPVRLFTIFHGFLPLPLRTVTGITPPQMDKNYGGNYTRRRYSCQPVIQVFPAG